MFSDYRLEFVSLYDPLTTHLLGISLVIRITRNLHSRGMQLDKINTTIEIDVHFSESFFENYRQAANNFLECYLLDKERLSDVGLLTCRHLSKPENTEFKNLKRKIEELQKHPSKSKRSSIIQHPLSVPRKDVHTALNDLNLMPQMGSDLACSMCPYIATQKGNLKVHYKLKHLGGADLIMTCKICGLQMKTKGVLKRHYMNVHCLSDCTAQNMMSK